MLFQCAREAFNVESQNMHRKLIAIRFRIPGCPLCCSDGFPKLPQGAKIVPQRTKMEHQARQTMITENGRTRSEITIIEKGDMETNIQRATSHNKFQQRVIAKPDTNSKNYTNEQTIDAMSRLQSHQTNKSASPHL